LFQLTGRKTTTFRLPFQPPPNPTPHYLLPGAVPLPHGLQAAVPVEQLEHGHQFLELQHGARLVRRQHKAERSDACVGVVGFFHITLGKRRKRKMVKDHEG